MKKSLDKKSDETPLPKKPIHVEAGSGRHRSIFEQAGRKSLFNTSELSKIIKNLRAKEEALLRSQEELEARVAERTAHLAKINADLHREISERHQIADKLQQQINLLHTLIDGIPDIVALQGIDHTIKFYNKAGYTLLNSTPSEVNGTKCFQLIGRDSPCEVCATGQAIASKQPEMVERYIPEYKIWLEAHSIPILDENNEVKMIVEILRNITEWKRTEETLRRREKELEMKTSNLEEANVALKVLLKRVDEDKTELEEKILLNMKELVIPFLEKLMESRSDDLRKSYIEIIEKNINAITAPFAHRMLSKHLNLSPRELKIANLIKQDKSSKEIAGLLHVSLRTIAFHRGNIRKKFGLKKGKTSLKTHLISFYK